MKIDHIGLYVSDLESAKSFFERYFGANSNEMYHNQLTHFKSYFLRFEDNSRLEIMTRPEVCKHDKNPFKGGFVHIAFTVGNEQAVDALAHRLENDGYKIYSYPRTTGDGYYECCVYGFEDNLIEIVAEKNEFSKALQP